jgi:hypothetical protein
MKFAKGDRVLVRHQLDLGVCVVSNPCDPTDAKMITAKGEVPVGHYVRIDSEKKTGMGYHEDNLEAEILHKNDQPAPFIETEQ